MIWYDDPQSALVSRRSSIDGGFPQILFPPSYAFYRHPSHHHLITQNTHKRQPPCCSLTLQNTVEEVLLSLSLTRAGQVIERQGPALPIDEILLLLLLLLLSIDTQKHNTDQEKSKTVERSNTCSKGKVTSDDLFYTGKGYQWFARVSPFLQPVFTLYSSQLCSKIIWLYYIFMNTCFRASTGFHSLLKVN